MRRADLAGLLVFFVLLAGLAAGHDLLRTADRGKAELRTALVASELAARIEKHIADRLSVIHLLRGEILRGAISDKKSFIRRVSEVRRSITGFNAIFWVSREGTLTWVAAEPGTRDATGYNLLNHPVAGPIVRRLIAEPGEAGATPPVDLLVGGRGFVAYVPVISHTGLKGFVGPVFVIDQLVSEAVGTDLANRYHITIRDGDAPVLNADSAGAGTFGRSSAEISIVDRTWVVSLVPRMGSPGQSRHNTRNNILIGIGALIAVCIALLLRSLLIRNDALRVSEARFRNFGEASSDWFWEMDENLRFSFFSDRFTEVTGVPQEALLGKTRHETGIPDVDQDVWERHLLALSEHRPFRNFIHSRKRDDGTLVWLAISGIPVFEADGEFAGYRGTGRDITATWEVEAALEESRSRLKAILDNAPASIYLKDACGRYIAANKAFLDRYGLSSEEVVGRTAREVFSGEDVEPHARIDDAVLATGTAREAELTDVKNTERVTHTIKFPIFDTDGAITSVGGIETDVTERKRSEQSLIDALEHADAASRAKSEFLANVSHELRTPLNAIIGFSEVVKNEMMGPLRNERYRTYLGDIHQSGQHLLSLINDILDLSKIEAGKFEADEHSVDVADIAETCIRLMGRQAKAAGVDLQSEFRAGGLRLRTDPRVLKQILLNLLSNAVKFTMAGGEVLLACEITPAGEARISVSDNGIGMTPEELNVAMRPFARGGNAMVRQHEGTGLGLPLVQRFADALDAELCVETVWQEGTTVSLDFPAERLIAGRPAAVAGQPDQDLARGKLQKSDLPTSQFGLSGKVATG